MTFFQKKIYLFNKATFSSLGTHPETAYSNPMYPFDIAHPDDLYLQYKKIDKTTDFSKPIQARMQNNNGEYVWFEDNVIPFFNSDGDLIAISGFCRNIQDRKELEQKLEELNYHDSLTGLFSNNYYTLHAKRLNEACDCSLGLIMCDLDNLKVINDTMGHAYGDKLIINFANLLKNKFGNRSILIRKGGDEFIILVENITEETIKQIYFRLLEAMDNYNYMEPLLLLKASVGWAYSPTSLGQIDKIFKAADKMMYGNKLEKKNSVFQQLND